MSKFKEYLKKQNIELSPKRYFIDAMSAMAQGLFASLLIGTILKTIGQQINVKTLVDVGQYAFDMCGPAIAVAIGYALHASPLVLFSLVGVGFAGNKLGGAGGPLAVYVIAIIACECGKLVSKRTKVDILVFIGIRQERPGRSCFFGRQDRTKIAGQALRLCYNEAARRPGRRQRRTL